MRVLEPTVGSRRFCAECPPLGNMLVPGAHEEWGEDASIGNLGAIARRGMKAGQARRQLCIVGSSVLCCFCPVRETPASVVT